jgi:hypothetical protein
MAGRYVLCVINGRSGALEEGPFRLDYWTRAGACGGAREVARELMGEGGSVVVVDERTSEVVYRVRVPGWLRRDL